MHIKKILLKNFKRFESAEISLAAPITVLVGPNSSGKSSILKSILALKQTGSSSNENEVLAAQGEYVDLGIYRDYVFNHEIGRNIEIGLEIPTKTLPSRTIIENPEEVRIKILFKHDHITQQARLQEINVWDIKSDELYFSIVKKETRDTFIMKCSERIISKAIRRTIIANDILEEKINKLWSSGISIKIDDRYNISYQKNSSNTSLPGNYINELPATIADTFIGAILREIDKNIFYLGPLRRSPSRSYRRTGHLISVGAAGEHTPSILANLKARAAKERSADRLQQDRLSQLEKWVEELFPGRSINAKNIDELIKLMIERGSSLGEAISDVGFGISQVLPILVQIAVMPTNSMLIIEQPELHLHPSVQTKLSEVIASATKEGRRFLVETHSEHFVRGLQLAISNARIKNKKAVQLRPEDVNVLYIPDAPKSPSTMEINEWGEFINDWPQGFFDEAYRATMKLLENKMKAMSNINN